MGLRRRRRCTRRREGRDRSGDGVVAREALVGVCPVGVFPFQFLHMRLNGSTMTVSVFEVDARTRNLGRGADQAIGNEIVTLYLEPWMDGGTI